MTRSTSSPSDSIAVLKVSTMDAEYQAKRPLKAALAGCLTTFLTGLWPPAAEAASNPRIENSTAVRKRGQPNPSNDESFDSSSICSLGVVGRAAILAQLRDIARPPINPGAKN